MKMEVFTNRLLQSSCSSKQYSSELKKIETLPNIINIACGRYDDLTLFVDNDKKLWKFNSTLNGYHKYKEFKTKNVKDIKCGEQ